MPTLKNHLRHQAEALAWPLVSPQAFRHAAYRIHPDALLPSLHARLLQLGGGRVEEQAQRAWRKSASLAEHLEYHGPRLLYPNGDCMRLVPNRDSPGLEILAWRWVSLALPPLLLSAAAMPPGQVAPARIQVLDPTLVPTGPVAHLHLHLGAAFPFELVWSHLAATVRFDNLRESPPEMGDVAAWRGWVVQALLARRVLAAHVRHAGPLAECSQCLPKTEPDLRRALGELATGRQAPYDPFREARLARLARGCCQQQPLRSEEDVWHNDPLPGNARHLPESVFLANSLAYLSGRDDTAYATLWSQYLRVRCILYRHLVADPAEGGLSTFARRYDRIGQYTDDALETLAPSLVFAEPELDLRAVEIRSGPPRNTGTLLVKAAQIEKSPLFDKSPLPPLLPKGESSQSKPAMEQGWVFHFIRDRGHDDKCPRYARIFRGHEKNARRLARALETWPDLLRQVRGLDLASQELKGPLWTVIPALQRVRAAARSAAGRKPGLQPLRLTLHVGEDFRHIAAGLRAIHEPFLWNLMERGDRLGHALALGVDAAQWCEEHACVLQPRLERILDLAWLLDFVTGPQPLTTDGVTVLRWQFELTGLLQAWSGRDDCHWQDGIALLREIGNPRALAQIGYPALLPAMGISRGRNPALSLLQCLLYPSAQQQAQAEEPVEVLTAPEATLLAGIQQSLAGLLARWQVTIEVNPSSNLLIGELSHPVAQPMFHLRPVGPQIANALPVAISADDPVTFSTRLADEYAYAWAGMVVANEISPVFARQWLDEVTDAGWRMRFTGI